MTRLAILTPDPADETYVHRWRAAYDVYRQAFEAAGVDTLAAPWVEPWPNQVAAVLPVRAWGYHKQADLWRRHVTEATVRLINPAPVLLWNTDKFYLDALAKAGAPTVPTLFAQCLDDDAISAAFAAFGDRLVIKPTISAGAWFTQVLKPGDPVITPPGPVMIQPFLDAVRGEGELSLFYFGGRFSHAARKVARGDDFRVQPQFGGVLTAYRPDDEAFAAAEQVLAAAPHGLIYARVDLIRGQSGALQLIELEAIEPDLFFDLDAGAADRFVSAVLESL